MLRILRLCLLVLVPTFTVGALVVGCGDDTTVIPPPADLSVPLDMAKVVHDMASHD